MAPLQPAMCWVAPLTPARMYTSGAILVPVWPTCSVCGPPARDRDGPRATDGPAQELGELHDGREALRRAGAASAGDDDLGLGERDARGGGRDPVHDANGEIGVVELRREHLDGRAAAGRRGGDDVRCHGQHRAVSMDGRLLEETAAPPLPRDRQRVAGRRSRAVRGERKPGPGGDARHHGIAGVRPGADDHVGAEAPRQVIDDPGDRIGRERWASAGWLATWTAVAP